MAIDKADLDEWKKLDDEVVQLKKRVKTINDRQEQLEMKFEEELKSSERSSIIRHGFTLAWIRGRSSVAWAKEFLRECGPEKVDTLKNATTETLKLSITAPLPE